MAIRSTKTVLLMKQALVELLEQKSLAEISIKELCARAGVNRSTFYCHFSNIEELFEYAEKALLNHIPQRPDVNKSDYDEKLLEYSQSFFEYIHNNAKLFKVILKRDNDSDFKETFVNKVMVNFKPDVSNSYLTDLGYWFSVYGTIGIIKKWIEDDFVISDRYFSEIDLKLCQGVNKIIKEKF